MDASQKVGTSEAHDFMLAVKIVRRQAMIVIPMRSALSPEDRCFVYKYNRTNCISLCYLQDDWAIFGH